MITSEDGLTVQPGGRITVYVWAVVILSVVATTAMVALAVLRPDNTSTGTLILGMMLPIITALLGAALQQIHVAVNSRLSELLVVTAKASHAEGQLQGMPKPPPPPEQIS